MIVATMSLFSTLVVWFTYSTYEWASSSDLDPIMCRLAIYNKLKVNIKLKQLRTGIQ